MEAVKLKEILKREYGIMSEEEFNEAVKKSAGINLGLFTMPLHGRSVKIEQKTETTVA